MKQVEFYFDLVSPYSYLAYGRVDRICRETGAELVLRPMLLGGVHKAVGLRAPIEIPAKGRYQLRDIHRWAEYYGLPMRFPEPFPFRTLKTMRAATWCAAEGKSEAFAGEAFALYWEEGGAPKGLEEADEDGPLREAARRIRADLLEGAATNGAKEATTAAVSTEIVGNLKVREHHQRRTSSPRSSFFGAMSRSESRTNWRKSRKCY